MLAVQAATNRQTTQITHAPRLRGEQPKAMHEPRQLPNVDQIKDVLISIAMTVLSPTTMTEELEPEPEPAPAPAPAPAPTTLSRSDLHSFRPSFSDLPPELLSRIFTHLCPTDLKTTRLVFRRHAYLPLLTTPLFRTITLYPHAQILKRFAETFASSPLRHSGVIAELSFVELRVWDLWAVQMAVEQPGLGDHGRWDSQWPVLREGEDGDGDMGFEEDDDCAVYRTSDEEVERGQQALVPLLVDVFEAVPAVRSISSRFNHIPTKKAEVSGRDPNGERQVVGVLHRRGANRIQRRMRLRYALLGTVYYVLGLSRLKLECVQIRLTEDSLMMALRWWHQEVELQGQDPNVGRRVHNGSSGKGRMIDALADLKQLKIVFDDNNYNDIIDRHLSSSRMALFRKTPNLESLDVLLEPNAYCARLLASVFADAASSLQSCFPHNGEGAEFAGTPLFPKLHTLHLRWIKCRAAELEYFLRFHCPALRDLVLQDIFFMYEEPRLPECWVQFLKRLKRGFSTELSLDIRGSLCNHAFPFAGHDAQHWHVASSTEELGQSDGKWFKDVVIDWFHHPELSDKLCPLNAWELDPDTGMCYSDRNRARIDEVDRCGTATPFVMDSSWRYEKCLDSAALDDERMCGLYMFAD